MAYFAALALLIVYCDAVVIVAAAATVAVHHLLLSLLVPTMVFPDGGSLGRVVLHAVILVLEAGTLVWVSVNLNHMFAVSRRAVESAEAAAAQARQLTLVADGARQAETAAKERADLSEEEALSRERKLVVSSIGKAMQALARGHLGYRISEHLPGEYGQLRDHFNEAVGQLQATVDEIATSAADLHAISDSITGLSDGLSHRTSQQMSALEDTAAALHEISATVKGSADGAKQVANAATDAKNDAIRSGAVMTDAIAAMSMIERSSMKITQIIGVIDEIAFQTNLLALNAGVEAARAGDAGRGFAVVAQEVRALAQRSAAAAKEIKDLIESSSSEVSRGVGLVGDTGRALHQIGVQITMIDTLISGIARSTQEQSLGIGSVSNSVHSMDQVAQKNASMVGDTSAAAVRLASEAERLKSLINQFQSTSLVARRRVA